MREKAEHWSRASCRRAALLCAGVMLAAVSCSSPPSPGARSALEPGIAPQVSPKPEKPAAAIVIRPSAPALSADTVGAQRPQSGGRSPARPAIHPKHSDAAKPAAESPQAPASPVTANAQAPAKPADKALLRSAPASAVKNDVEKCVRLPVVSVAPAKPRVDPLKLGKDAMAAQDFRSALDWFEQAVRAKGKTPQAYYQLAVCRTELGDLPGAIEAYELLGAETDRPLWRRLAESRTENLKRSLGYDLLFRAERMKEAGNWPVAGASLQKAVALRLSPALDQRARDRYYQVQAERIAEAIVRAVARWGGVRLDVAPFRSPKRALCPEAADFHDLVLAAIRTRKSVRLKAASEPDKQDVEAALGDPKAWDAGDGPPEGDPLLVGTVGDEARVRLVSREPVRVLFEDTFDRLGAIPPGAAAEMWRELPESSEPHRGFDIEVWSSAESLSARPQASGFFRVSRDSFVNVFQVFDDGSMVRVFPGAEDGAGFVRGARVVRMKWRGPATSRKASSAEPRGFWAIATLVEPRIDIEGLDPADAARSIRYAVERLPEGSWVSSYYRFRVLKVAVAATR